jgi:hypothetical protein
MSGVRQDCPDQFVSPGTQIITLLPLSKLWLIANIKETQMTNIRVGDRAIVLVDAFPDVVLSGWMESWSPGTGSVFALLPPDNTTVNFTKVVQRMPVRTALEPNPALGVLIRPGMSVIATIDTGGASGETRAATGPRAGRRWRPRPAQALPPGQLGRVLETLCRSGRRHAGLDDGDTGHARHHLRSRRSARQPGAGFDEGPGSRRR